MQDTTHPINEVARIVVVIPGSYHRHRHMVIVRDAGAGLCVIGQEPTSYPFNSGECAVGTMCSYRAALTVRGRLLLNGERVTPEYYLRTWRAVVPTSPEDLRQRHGVEAFARIAVNLAAERAKSWRHTEEGSRVHNLDSFFATYPLDDAGIVTVPLDTVKAFADLETWRSNCARETGGNYLALSPVTFLASDVDTAGEARGASCTYAYQQAELI
ncbi:hypothetical protein [Noviherbaspirillum pedocola]|uniref:Uncharacterized protein n=1 Tax=Noviherbaspirillum pedocola TaxID=2801341 RepID=A0A934SUX8_9BURK|nr:hypothetical protein [Noviherbaspirillum pedocola]MBK4736039.1 hypothetical protein [Noviherbaspirillum pedocola]